MDIAAIQQILLDNPTLAFLFVLISSVIGFLLTRYVVGRGLLYLSRISKTKYDDILVKHLSPYRVSWLAPLIIVYVFADLFPNYQLFLERTTRFIILWLVILALNNLVDAVNQIYESSPNYTGVSIQGYLDLLKLLFIIVGLVLSFSIVTGQTPLVMLTGLTALTAVLILIFRDTLLSIVASVQIVVNDLLREGDLLEVPSYHAEGEVINIGLHTIKVQNLDKTISIIPTYKMMEVSYKNWRGMLESGGRRIKRAINIDLETLKFCDREMLERCRKVDILKDYMDKKIQELDAYTLERGDTMDFPLDGPHVTNVSVFQAYMDAYLRAQPAIHKEEMVLLVRQLEPTTTGLPLEVYGFTRTTEWIEYETILAEIFSHFLAAAPHFDLRIFQEPTGGDFKILAQSSVQPL